MDKNKIPEELRLQKVPQFENKELEKCVIEALMYDKRISKEGAKAIIKQLGAPSAVTMAALTLFAEQINLPLVRTALKQLRDKGTLPK